MVGYKEYKSSKLNWIDSIPSHWIESKINYLFSIGRGRVISNLELIPDGKYPVFSSQTKNDGCMGYIDTYDFDDDLLTWTTDGANAGTVFIRSGKFNCTNVCGTLKSKENLVLKYYLYYLQFVTQFYKRPDTNGAKIMNNEMAAIYAIKPSLEEQKKIAEYLDYKTAIIDEIIAKKQKLIAALDEKKKSIINDIVTGKKVWNGSIFSTPTQVKDSGIQWLGQIPEHWEVYNLKYLTKKVGSGITPKGGADVYAETGVKFIRSQNVYFEGLLLDDIVHISPEIHHSMKNSTVKYGDVLLNITGGSIGRSTVVETTEELNVNQHVCIIRPNEKLFYKFLNYFLFSDIGQNNIRDGITGGNREGLNFENIKKFKISLPNTIEEQIVLCDYLDNKIQELDLIKSKINTQIEKIKEYRQAVIAEAVTGKIDVRHWTKPNN